MRCGSRRHCSKQGAKWLRWGITAKCSLCLLAVVVVVVVVAVYRLALLASSPFRFEAICIHNMHAKSESELRSRKTEIVANAALGSALLCLPFPPAVQSRRPSPFRILLALSRSEAHNLQPPALKDLCPGHRLSQSNLLASSSSAAGAFFAARGFCRVAKLNFCLWLSICNCNWPREKCKLHNAARQQSRLWLFLGGAKRSLDKLSL